jgi:SPP1 gp7 family putative phage head morphogenesis protein
MASPAERILSESVLHRIALSRYSTATVRKVLAQLNRTDADLVERILRADNEGRDPRQLERLLDEVRALQANGWAVVRGRLTDDLEALAEAERDFAAKMVRFGQQSAGASLATNIPTTGQVVAAVNARPFQGRFLRDWLAEAEAGSAKRVRETLRQGFIEGRSVADIVRQVRGSRALQYRDGILEISRRGAEAMVRTAITHTAAVSSRVTYEALGVTRATFIAVLDARTTLTCAGLNGKTFDLDKFPFPPRHVNCRSTLIPVVAGLKPVPVRSYAEWLRGQPEAVQDDILGPARGKLFRAGKLTIDRFTDSAGRVLTLEQLRKRDAGAFSR